MKKLIALLMYLAIICGCMACTSSEQQASQAALVQKTSTNLAVREHSSPTVVLLSSASSENEYGYGHKQRNLDGQEDTQYTLYRRQGRCYSYYGTGYNRTEAGCRRSGWRNFCLSSWQSNFCGRRFSARRCW